VSQDKVLQIGFSRDGIGRGWTDVLDNQIAIMGALLLLPEVQKEKAYDVRQGLQYRINQTASYLHGTKPAEPTSS
jgi:hypothetical protein